MVKNDDIEKKVIYDRLKSSIYFLNDEGTLTTLLIST